MDRSSRPWHLAPRTIALAAAALAALLPTAAAGAGPARGHHEPRPTAARARAEQSSGNARTDVFRLLPPADATADTARPAPDGGGHVAGTGPRTVPAEAPARAPLGGASCGPALTSREGLRAQTCLLREGGRVWARSYYRNATGSVLRLVLALARPDGRAVEVFCPIPAAEGSGTCETPRVDGAGTSATGAAGTSSASGARALPYGAVAEVASEDGSRLLLRSGSNAPVG
jgi:hypothetical protein